VASTLLLPTFTIRIHYPTVGVCTVIAALTSDTDHHVTKRASIGPPIGPRTEPAVRVSTPVPVARFGGKKKR
jgi:hypothetical protein